MADWLRTPRVASLDCALDFDDLSNAVNFVSKINYDIVFKIGMEFFYNNLF